MSIGKTSLAVARRWADRAVAYLREFVLIAAYAALCVAVVAPAVVATGGVVYWGQVQLGLEGTARTAYLAAGVVVVMFEFAMLYRLVELLGDVMLGSTRGRKI